MRLPRGWSADGWTFWEPFADEGAEPRDYSGIWHVTTAASAVRRAGRLLSRRELHAARIRHVGLGGGPLDLAPDRVSVVVRPEAAERLVRAMSLAALAARNRIPAWIVAREAVNFSGWYDYAGEAGTRVWDYEEKVAEYDAHVTSLHRRLIPDYGWTDTTEGDPDEIEVAWSTPDARAALEKAHSTGYAKYMLIRDIEDVAIIFRQFAIGDAGPAEDLILRETSPVTFTEPWERWKNVDPRDIRALRLAVRKEADVDPFPAEGELRFLPKDVRVLGAESWTGLVAWRAPAGRTGRRTRRPFPA